jgi:hypothetical protein
MDQPDAIGARKLSITRTGDGSRQLDLGSSELGALFEPIDGFRDLSLLQAQLSECGDSYIAVRIDIERLFAEIFGLLHVLLPLEDSEGLVYPRQNVLDARRPGSQGKEGANTISRQVYQEESVASCSGLPFLLGGHRQAELVDSVFESLLIQKQLSAAGSTHGVYKERQPDGSTREECYWRVKDLLVVVGLGSLGEVLQDLSESNHALSDLTDLVLADRLLNMRKYKVLVEFGGFIVVGRRLGEL